jgi:hypothetical protein
MSPLNEALIHGHPGDFEPRFQLGVLEAELFQQFFHGGDPLSVQGNHLCTAGVSQTSKE